MIPVLCRLVKNCEQSCDCDRLIFALVTALGSDRVSISQRDDSIHMSQAVDDAECWLSTHFAFPSSDSANYTVSTYGGGPGEGGAVGW